MDSVGLGAAVPGKIAEPHGQKAPRNRRAGLGDHRLTAGEVSTLMYLPVAHESLMVNESGEVKEE